MSALTWADLAPYGEPDFDDDEASGFETVYIVQAVVDGVEWTSDRYIAVPTSSLADSPLRTQFFSAPSRSSALDQVIRNAHIRSDEPDHHLLSAYFISLANRMGWTLTPSIKHMWTIWDGDQFAGAIAGKRELGYAPGDDISRVEIVARRLVGMTTGGARERYDFATQILADLGEVPR